MTSHGIGFGNILDEEAKAVLERWKPTYSTVIKCQLCETSFYYHDLVEEDELDMDCECGNIVLKSVPTTQAKFKAFIGVYYDEDYPHIYEIPYKDYLETKD